MSARSSTGQIVSLTPPHGADSTLKEAQLLQWLGQDTITFNRAFVDLTGNVLSALWLGYVLDQIPAFVRDGRASVRGANYSFAMTGQECEDATGITRAQQSTCRRQLAAAGLLVESSDRGSVAIYTLHLDRISAKLAQMAQPLAQALAESRGLPPGAAPTSGRIHAAR